MPSLTLQQLSSAVQHGLKYRYHDNNFIHLFVLEKKNLNTIIMLFNSVDPVRDERVFVHDSQCLILVKPV